MVKLKLSTAVAPILRTTIGLAVSVAVLAAALHYTPARWKASTVSDTSKTITNYGAANNSWANEYYKTLVDYSPVTSYKQYKADDYDREIAIRVGVVGLGISMFESSASNEHFIDVVEDLSIYVWIAFGWFAALIVITAVAAVVELFDLVEQVDEEGEAEDMSMTARVIRIIYSFITAFESHEQTIQFLRNVNLGAPDNVLLNSVALLVRGVMSTVREGFFIFAAIISMSYAFISLTAHQGPCDDTALAGKCSVQWGPVQRLEIVLVVILALMSRLASAYNYTDGNWDAALSNINSDLKRKEGIDITEAVGLLGDIGRRETWMRIFEVAKEHLTSATMQGLACSVSVGSSLLALLMIGSAYFSIDESRRYPYEAIWYTILILEIIFMSMNVLVWLMSTTSWIRDLSTLKFYIEGKLWGALYLSAIVMTIYMTHRRAINMFGTYVPKNTGDVAGSNDYLAPKTFSVFHGKQLSQKDSWCHYIPRAVFDDKTHYRFQGSVQNIEDSSCTDTSFDSGNATNGVTTYTGLWVALAGMVLQVALLIVTALFHEGGAAAKAVDNVADKISLPKIKLPSAPLQNKGFKTIQVV